MQPLISPVDHESHSNSYRNEEQPPAETTPLIDRFPRDIENDYNHLRTRLIVSLLIIILLGGIIIGTYLLIIESNSENLLPPITNRLRMVRGDQWIDNNEHYDDLDLKPKTRIVIVVQTDNGYCKSPKSASELYNTIQMYGGTLPFNFLVTSNGEIYNALGWDIKSPLYLQYPASIVLGFIGNYSQKPPTELQMQEVKNFFDRAIKEQNLESDYIIIVKKKDEFPKYLYLEICKLPQCIKELSDEE